MANKTFKLEFKTDFFDKIAEKFKEIPAGIDKKCAQKVGKAVVDGIKDLTKKGISPIRGEGRMPRYKNPKKYPGDRFPGKKKTPVNLRLTGDMMRSLGHKESKDGAAYKTVVKYDDPDQEIKEQGHREGANDQPKRPTLAQGNEEIAKTIENEVRDLYLEALERQAKKSLK